MTEPHEELLGITEELEKLAARGRKEDIQEPICKLEHSADEVRKAWCGSWMGYHANVYHFDLRPPPQGSDFLGKWGKYQNQSDWDEFTPKIIFEEISNRAEEPDLGPAETFNHTASDVFKKSKLNLLSILDLAIQNTGTSFLSELRDTAKKLSLISKSDFVNHWMSDPSQSRLIPDTRTVFEKPRTPPHFWIFGEINEIRQTLNMVDELVTLTRQAAAHVQRQARQQQRMLTRQSLGTQIFIGHGRSHIWRALKDFLEDDLGLLVDEFNRIPTAGASITGRLETMLNSAAIAFLVMTGEDEQPSGELRARENVVHEAGLFQGRLGFERAVVLLEEGCEKFSNNAGLGHIPFPKDNIRAAFQDIREVLEREGIVHRGSGPLKRP